eukprot:TRINITY_DN11821_c0_g1_i2.p1 TRINITY_DN11821_c0_g1~~TRINITY_DN11821_c0_g1_i2.p1  ORF type:complete len:910 (+),score=158.10 TRINITY_DN11821_c0_g1_i2:170-2731(+)
MALVEYELRKVNQFVAGRVAELVNRGHYLERHGQTLDIDSEFETSTEHLVKLHQFTWQCAEGFRKILKKYRKYTGFTTVWFDRWQKDESMCHLHKAQSIMHGLMVQLSNFYWKHRESSDQDWDPPASFSRKTTKYWVKAEDVYKAKAFIVKHLPILEVNSSDQIDIDYHRQEYTQTHNYISSIYFDNSSLGCYHDRINLLEGAQLFRMRWYGGALTHDTLLPVPTTKNLFIERKTHHEKWVKSKSVKERFQLKRSSLPAFCQGTLNTEAELRDQLAQGKIKEKEFEKATVLAQEYQRAMVDRNLRPKIRTVYHRTAFQLSTSNEVRMSLDHPVMFVNDGSAPFATIDDKRKYWESLEFYKPDDMMEFPWAIVELKLADQENPPDWVESLLGQDWLIPAAKFSKFQHSIASYYPQKCKQFPYWIDSVNIDEQDEDVPERVSHVKQAPRGQAAAKQAVQAHMSTSHEIDLDAVLGMDAPFLDPTKHHASDKPADTDIVAVQSGGRKVQVKNPKKGFTRTRVEPKTYFANERTFIQWLGASLLLVTLAVALFEVGGQAKTLAYIFFGVAITFIGYSCGIYYWRLDKIKSLSASRYDDPYGPAILSVVLVAALIASFANQSNDDDGSARIDGFPRADVDSCSSSVTSFGAFQPRGLTRNGSLWLTATESAVIAASRAMPFIQLPALSLISSVASDYFTTTAPQIQLYKRISALSAAPVCQLNTILPDIDGQEPAIRGLSVTQDTVADLAVEYDFASFAVALNMSSCTVIRSLRIPARVIQDIVRVNVTSMAVLAVDHLLIINEDAFTTTRLSLPMNGAIWTGLDVDSNGTFYLLDGASGIVSSFSADLVAGQFVTCD